MSLSFHIVLLIGRAYQRLILVAVWVAEQLLGIWAFVAIFVQVALVIIVIVVTEYGEYACIVSNGVIRVVVNMNEFILVFIMCMTSFFVTWVDLLLFHWVVLFLFAWIMVATIAWTVHIIAAIGIASISTGRQSDILGVILKDSLVLLQCVKMRFLVMNSWRRYKLFAFRSQKCHERPVHLSILWHCFYDTVVVLVIVSQ